MPTALRHITTLPGKCLRTARKRRPTEGNENPTTAAIPAMKTPIAASRPSLQNAPFSLPVTTAATLTMSPIANANHAVRVPLKIMQAIISRAAAASRTRSHHFLKCSSAPIARTAHVAM